MREDQDTQGRGDSVDTPESTVPVSTDNVRLMGSVAETETPSAVISLDFLAEGISLDSSCWTWVDEASTDLTSVPNLHDPDFLSFDNSGCLGLSPYVETTTQPLPTFMGNDLGKHAPVAAPFAGKNLS